MGCLTFDEGGYTRELFNEKGAFARGDSILDVAPGGPAGQEEKRNKDNAPDARDHGDFAEKKFAMLPSRRCLLLCRRWRSCGRRACFRLFKVAPSCSIQLRWSRVSPGSGSSRGHDSTNRLCRRPRGSASPLALDAKKRRRFACPFGDF